MQPEIIHFDLTAENIDNFVPIKNQRAVRRQQVARLKTAIRNGEYIEASPIFVSSSRKVVGAGKVVVIDGNHRILAIRELLHQKVDTSFSVVLGVFYNIPESMQRDVYDRIAKQVPQTINDLINLHKDEFLLWDILNKKPFPVKTTIYPSQLAIDLRTLLNMLDCSMKQQKSAMTGISRDEILNVGRKTTEDDFYTLSEFFKVFVAIFGDIGKHNRYANSNFLHPLYYVWKRNIGYKKERLEYSEDPKLVNRHNYKRKVFWMKRFQRLIGDTRIIELCNFQSSRENKEKGVDLILSILNDHNVSRGKKKGKYQDIEYEDFK